MTDDQKNDSKRLAFQLACQTKEENEHSQHLPHTATTLVKAAELIYNSLISNNDPN